VPGHRRLVSPGVVAVLPAGTVGITFAYTLAPLAEEAIHPAHRLLSVSDFLLAAIVSRYRLGENS
jgi:hypothetical protein